jgi:hypothetical protein
MEVRIMEDVRAKAFEILANAIIQKDAEKPRTAEAINLFAVAMAETLVRGWEALSPLDPTVNPSPDSPSESPPPSLS